MKQISKHNAVIAAYVGARKGWDTRGLGRKFAAATEQPQIYLGFIPDAFSVDVANKTVWLLEVDGDSYTQASKLQRLLDFWTVVDGSSWFLHQTTINLLTGEVSVVDDDSWCRLWHDNKESKRIKQ